jgi:hypothetical protein
MNIIIIYFMKPIQSNVETTFTRTQLMVIERVKDLRKQKELLGKLLDAQDEYLGKKGQAENLFYKRIAEITEEIAACMT